MWNRSSAYIGQPTKVLLTPAPRLPKEAASTASNPKLLSKLLAGKARGKGRDGAQRWPADETRQSGESWPLTPGLLLLQLLQELGLGLVTLWRLQGQASVGH